MIRQIILALFAFIILSLVVIWILNKGPQRIFAQVKSFSFAGSTSTDFALPWQPSNIFSFIEEEDLFGPDAAGANANPDQTSENTGGQYGEIIGNPNDVMTFGDPSPYFRSVHISGAYSNPQTSDIPAEYIVIEASAENTTPISLEGWSLQSALTGVRIALPPAASPLRGGSVNAVNSVSLEPGAYAIIASGASPVGVSFRENICTGYISQFQTFEPALSLNCPSPSGELPLTPENLSQYGDACFDFIYSIPTCEFPKQVPSIVSPACRSFLQNTLSYNGCMNRHYMRSSFDREAWRLYLESDSALWRDQRDVVRLLDDDGRTVDAYVY
ncbi:MAG: hypothetical protein G01um10148_128 [Parcubacteria group bacterium Gr01-1014_8]|nr:MAG: hypothetical protein G01um10148_128 [Parcubacteria group bacterium Gr01-1014_8]